jgi:hypothetical protein
MVVQSDVEYFARLVDALEPWLDQVVIIGGWAHRLYRQHPLAQPLDYEPLGTFGTRHRCPSRSARYRRADSRAAARKGHFRSIHPSCRVLLVSGHSATEDLLATANLQGHDFEILAKPFHPNELLASIRNGAIF